MKNCVVCRKEFEPIQKHQKYCRTRCKHDSILGKRAYTSVTRRDSTKTGMASEALVTADLFLKGYEVFKAISHSSPWDLVAIHPNNPIAIKLQVKTGNRYNNKIVFSKPSSNNYDCLVIVIPEENYIEYRPDLDNYLRTHS